MYANQSAANLVDTTLKEMTGASIEDYIDPMNMDRAKILSQKVLIENTPLYDFDLRIRSENGEIIDAVLSAIPINYVGKKAIMVSCRDITVRKKMEQALKESEERYRHLIDNVPLGILIHENCIIQYVNTTGLSIIGAKRLNDIVGEHINKIIHPDYQTIVNRRIERIKEGKSTPAFYEKFIRFDGKEIDVEVKGLPIQMNGKLFVQVV
ncbi:PAS domain S-box protein, partial [Butyricicoccus sp. 1XD8-22]